MKYVSPEYQRQLAALAETLCVPDRFGKDVGQIALFEVEAPKDNVVQLHPVTAPTPPEAA